MRYSRCDFMGHAFRPKQSCYPAVFSVNYLRAASLHRNIFPFSCGPSPCMHQGQGGAIGLRSRRLPTISREVFWRMEIKSIAMLQALSFYLSPADRSRLPEGSLELWRESKNKLVAENFERVTRDFGDFKDYNVLRVKTTTISPQDQPAANMMGSGIHTELVCKAKFSKKHDAHVGLHLIKETEGSQYIVAAWNFQAAP